MVWPIIGLWIIFPFIAWWISRPLVAHEVKLSDKQYRFLRELSRKTWHFFETFVGQNDNWLPPDNYPGTSQFSYSTPDIAHQYWPFTSCKFIGI